MGKIIKKSFGELLELRPRMKALLIIKHLGKYAFSLNMITGSFLRLKRLKMCECLICKNEVKEDEGWDWISSITEETIEGAKNFSVPSMKIDFNAGSAFDYSTGALLE